MTSGRDKQVKTADDWQRFDAMTDDEITARALADPDAQPLTDEQLEAMRRPRPICKVVRNKLRMTRHSFAAAYGIPLDKLAAWERREAEPTEVELAYLRLIEREPEVSKLQPVSA